MKICRSQSVQLRHIFYIEWKGIEYPVAATARYVVDNHYGADADGNRGSRETWIEDIEVIGIKDDAIDGLDKEDVNQIYAMADELAENHEWREDIPEPDYDY